MLSSLSSEETPPNIKENGAQVPTERVIVSSQGFIGGQFELSSNNPTPVPVTVSNQWPSEQTSALNRPIQARAAVQNSAVTSAVHDFPPQSWASTLPTKAGPVPINQDQILASHWIPSSGPTQPNSEVYSIISPAVLTSGVYEQHHRIYSHPPTTLVRASSTSTALPVVANSSSTTSLNLRAGSLAGTSLGNLSLGPPRSGPGVSEDYYTTIGRPTYSQYHHNPHVSSSSASATNPGTPQQTLASYHHHHHYPVVVQDLQGQRYMISRGPGSTTFRREEVIPAPTTPSARPPRRTDGDGWKGVQRAFYQCASCCVKCLGPV